MEATHKSECVAYHSPQVDDEASSSSSIPISPSHIAKEGPHSLLRSPSSSYPKKMQLVFPGLPLNGGSFNHQAPRAVMLPPRQGLGALVLRRSASEGVHTPDSGVSFTTTNDLHNAKVSARAMDRALSDQLRGSDAKLVKKQKEAELRQGQRMALTSNEEKEQRDRNREFSRGQELLPIDALKRSRTPANKRGNPLKPHRGRDLASLPSTSRLNQDQTKGNGKLLSRFSLRRRRHTTSENKLDEPSPRLKYIEQADQPTQKRILEEHISSLSRVLEEMPPLSEGPRRDVEVVAKTELTDRERGVAGVFGHAGKDGDVDMKWKGNEGDRENKANRLKKMLGRAKTLCQKPLSRKEA